MAYPGEKNPNWKGGRTVASNGYVLIKKPEHPHADVRGYVYEHRYVASKKLDRTLKDDELVHHKNGDKQDNRWENLEVMKGNAEHIKEHGRYNPDTRDPGEDNPEIECACGCGDTLKKYDSEGRPREYISGHNMGFDISKATPHAPVQDEVLEILENGPMRKQEVIKATGHTQAGVTSALTTLKKRGAVSNPKNGVWCLTEHADQVTTWREQNEEIKCACGCGETFMKYDQEGREREYVSGHNNESFVKDGILELLAEGPKRRKALKKEVDGSPNAVGTALRRLKEDGRVETADGWGMWKLAEAEQ